MDPETPDQNKEVSPKNKLRLFIIVGAVFLLLALSIFYIVVIRGGGSASVGIQSLLPFGDSAPDVTPDGGGVGSGKLDDIAIDGGDGGTPPRMFKIADGPVSGSVFKTLPDGSLSVRYVVREDGDIHEYSMDTRAGRILANNTVPRVAEAVWDARGQSVILRTATDRGNVVSILGRLLPNSATSTGDEAPAILQQSFLPENIAFVVPGPREGFIYTLSVGSEVTLMMLGGNGETTPVFSSPFTEWIPEWPEKNTLMLTTRPSGVVGGYFFSKDIERGNVLPVLNDVPGLTTRGAPDGSRVLVGSATKGGMSFGVITKDLPVTSELLPATLPEKCTWTASSTFAYCGVPQSSPQGTYPDDWYQGVAQFSDTLWVYRVDTESFVLVLVPYDEVGVDVDIISPVVSTDGEYLTFINKKDGSLWGVSLSALSIPIYEDD